MIFKTKAISAVVALFLLFILISCGETVKKVETDSTVNDEDTIQITDTSETPDIEETLDETFEDIINDVEVSDEDSTIPLQTGGIVAFTEIMDGGTQILKRFLEMVDFLELRHPLF